MPKRLHAVDGSRDVFSWNKSDLAAEPGAAHRNSAESDAPRQIALPSPTANRRYLPGVTVAFGIDAAA